MEPQQSDQTARQAEILAGPFCSLQSVLSWHSLHLDSFRFGPSFSFNFNYKLDFDFDFDFDWLELS